MAASRDNRILLNDFINIIGRENWDEKFKNRKTPFYLYSLEILKKQIHRMKSMPNPYGLEVSYAVKANSNLSILKLIADEELCFDASSLNEVRRIEKLGLDLKRVMLTTQDVPDFEEIEYLKEKIIQGLKFNICSITQLKKIIDLKIDKSINFSLRVHTGVGSGESQTRNTGDKYSCFGVHLSDIEKFRELTARENIKINEVHVHIGSGSDPEIWMKNVEKQLEVIKDYFPETEIVNFGGGFRVARVEQDIEADIIKLGKYAGEKIEEYYKKHGVKLKMKVEPGTFITANSGVVVTRVIDIKATGEDGFKFIITDGGMETNIRPLLYGSKHPMEIIEKGSLENKEKTDFIVVGKCCESGDCQSLDSSGKIYEVKLPEPETGDYLIIGGCGAYSPVMSPANYNSYLKPEEVLIDEKGSLITIRKRETFEEMVSNELSCLI